MSVNVYRESEVMPDCPSFILAHRLTKIPNAEYHVDLLLVTDDAGKSHYVYIKDIDRLLSRQINKNTHKSYHCRNCLHPYTTKKGLENHIRNGCVAIEGTRLKLPEEGTTTKFCSMYKKFKAPFVIYADFECLTTKVSTSEPSNAESFTNTYQKHQQSGFTIYVVSSEDSIRINPIYTEQ